MTDVFLGIVARVMLIEEAEELLQIVLAVFIVEVDDKGERSDMENLHFFVWQYRVRLRIRLSLVHIS